MHLRKEPMYTQKKPPSSHPCLLFFVPLAVCAILTESFRPRRPQHHTSLRRLIVTSLDLMRWVQLRVPLAGDGNACASNAIAYGRASWSQHVGSVQRQPRFRNMVVYDGYAKYIP